VIRQRDGITRRRDQYEDESDSSVKEIGRLLQTSREERGLDLLTVHDRLGRPITQLEALETGDLAALPDQALALSTLRRYAAFLGLDGDALALRMIDAWSVVPPSPKSGGVHDSGTATVTNVVTAMTTGPEHLRAFTQTGEVPRVGGSSIGVAAGSNAYGYGLVTGPPTGTFPVVPKHDLKKSRRAMAKARRRFHAPPVLKVATWVCAILMGVVAVGFGLLRWNSKALVQAHILRVEQPGTPQLGTGGGATVAAASADHAPTKVVLTSVNDLSSTYTVGTSRFILDLSTSGRCWIQITSSNSPIPLISGVQPAGKILLYPADGTMTVQVGSTAVKVGVIIDKKTVRVITPHAVPFTYTFSPASAG